MKTPASNRFKGSIRAAKQWFFKTPERALEEAYQAALAIKGLEDAHFGGKKILEDYSSFSQSAQAYFRSELKKYINIAKVRLAEFRISSSALQISNQTITEVQVEDGAADWHTVNIIDKPAAILKKLKFIDEILARYSNQARQPKSAIAPPPQTDIPTNQLAFEPSEALRPRSQPRRMRAEAKADSESFADNTSVLPRSILRTVDRIKRELDPKAEEEVVASFRDSKARTIVALRFILLLIIIPLLTQQVSKNFVVGPIVDHFRSDTAPTVFLNVEMEEEALRELQRFEERFRFEILIGKVPPVSEEEIEAIMRAQAEEIEDVYRQRSSDAVKNVFSDIFSLVAFASVIFFSQREIAVLKSFIDEVIYGLSDSAKAFIIILFTDTFVGFHSPHGWEVLLEGISRHLGLPANRDFIFLFIATFPVILDTVFKYWIFRYLNRISPSAVATYKNMNE